MYGDWGGCYAFLDSADAEGEGWEREDLGGEARDVGDVGVWKEGVEKSVCGGAKVILFLLYVYILL